MRSRRCAQLLASLSAAACVHAKPAIEGCAAPSGDDRPVIVVVGGGFKGVAAAVNMVQSERNTVLLLERCSHGLLKSWDDIVTSRRLSQYAATHIDGGALNGGDVDEAGRRIEQTQRDIARVLNRTRVDYVKDALRVKRKLNNSLGVRVELGCTFNDSSLRTYENGSLSLYCAEGKLLLSRPKAAAGNATPFVIVDARAKDSFSAYRDEAAKLGSARYRYSPQDQRLPVSMYGYGQSANALLPLPRLLDTKVKIKTRSILWEDKSLVAQLSSRGQEFLKDMFTALTSREKVKLLVDYSTSLGDSLVAYSAGAITVYKAVQQMCERLSEMAREGETCDIFYNDTLSGQTSWCNASGGQPPDGRSSPPNCSEDCELAPCDLADDGLKSAWEAFLNDTCPLGEDGARHYHTANMPVACFRIEELESYAANDTAGLYFYGRLSYPSHPGAKDILNRMERGDLSLQPALFYVHLGYDVKAADSSVNSAIGYLLQAIAGAIGDYKTGGLLNFTANTSVAALRDAMSDRLKESMTAFCTCLLASVSVSTTCADAIQKNSTHTHRCLDSWGGSNGFTPGIKHLHRPLTSVGDLLHSADGGLMPGRPTVVDAYFFQWYGYPAFGTLGAVPRPSEADPPAWLGCVKENHGSECGSTTQGVSWAPGWICHSVHVVTIDLANYVAYSPYDSVRQYIWGSPNASDPKQHFKMQGYILSNKSGGEGDSRQWLIGVTADLYGPLLLDEIEPFVNTSCSSIRERVKEYAVNIGNWQEQAVLHLLLLTLAKCHDLDDSPQCKFSWRSLSCVPSNECKLQWKPRWGTFGPCVKRLRRASLCVRASRRPRAPRQAGLRVRRARRARCRERGRRCRGCASGAGCTVAANIPVVSAPAAAALRRCPREARFYGSDTRQRFRSESI